MDKNQYGGYPNQYGGYPDKYGYQGPAQFKPLSPWAYFGYSLLFSLPIIGFIMTIVLCFSDSNINRRNYARSYFVGLLIIVALTVVMFILLTAIGVIGAAAVYGSSYY